VKTPLAILGSVLPIVLLLLRTVAAQPESPVQQIQFRNAAGEAGIDFVLENNATSDKHIIETMLGGVAAFDYDGDGLSDLFFANGATIPSLQKDQPKFRNRLYRNLGGMRFKNVTEEAGLAGAGLLICSSPA